MPTAPNITIGIKERGAKQVEKSIRGLAAATTVNTKETAKLRKEQARQARAEQMQARQRAKQIQQWKNYGKAIAGVAIAASVRLIANSVKEAAALGSQLVEAGQRAGFTAERLQTLGRVVEGEGGSLAGLNKGLDRFNRAIAEAGDGIAEYKDAFDFLGVSVTDANGNLRGTEAIFNDVTKAISGLENGARKTQLIYDLFGRSSLALVNVLQRGSDALEAQEAGFRELGILTDDQARKLKALNQTLTDIQNENQVAMAEYVAEHAASVENMARAAGMLERAWIATAGFVGGIFADTVDDIKSLGKVLTGELSIAEAAAERHLANVARNRLRSLNAMNADIKARAGATADTAGGAASPAAVASLPVPRPSQQAIAEGVMAWREFWGEVYDEARQGRMDIEEELERLANLAGYAPIVTGTRMQKLQSMISTEINRAGSAQARANAALIDFGPRGEDLPEFVAETVSWVDRLGKSFDNLGQKASDSLKQIIVQGADATETVKRLLLTLGVDILTGAFEPGGLFRPAGRNVGGTIYPGQAYRVHEDETIVPVGSPLQVQPARSAMSTDAGETVVNITIEGYDRDRTALANEIVSIVETRAARREFNRQARKRAG